MNKILPLLALTICTSVFAKEQKAFFEPELLQGDQIYLTLDTKKVKKLIDNAKKTDSNVYDIEKVTMINPNKNKIHTDSINVIFRPSTVNLITNSENYRYITYGYTKKYYNDTIDYNYIITTVDCVKNLKNQTTFFFNEQGKYLVSSSYIIEMPPLADNRSCRLNPNKSED